MYGIICFGMGLTLREGSREYFYARLDEHFPGLKLKYQRKYGYSYEVKSGHNERLMEIFYSECGKHGIVSSNEEIFKYLRTYEENQEMEQLSLFS